MTAEGQGEDETRSLARLLTRQGCRVHVLDARKPIDGCPLSGSFQVPGLHEAASTHRSERIRHALEGLQRTRHFDLVVFPALGGSGFRTIQAKRAGLAFHDTALGVYLQTCSPWQWDRKESWPGEVEDLEVAFAERYAFEHADVQMASSPSLLDRAGQLGWHIPPQARVLSGLSDLIQEGAAWPISATPSTDGDPPLVTVGMAHYNLGRYLPEALASLAGQTYPRLEVLAIDDGSTEERSCAVFEDMSSRYPQFRFQRQANAGIGATRNRALKEAQGSYFIPMDADNVARPDMVERLVTAMRLHPDVAAMSCYFLAFGQTPDLARQRYLYAYRPTGGPHVLSSLRNVYGDANAIFHTDRFRAVGGFETDRDTSCEDWEAFVKLVHAGHRVEVVPDYLFFYRHLETGFSRVTSPYRNHQRVLRQFDAFDRLPRAERVLLWRSFVGFQRRMEHLAQENRCLRYRIADGLYALCRHLPIARRALKRLFLGFWQA